MENLGIIISAIGLSIVIVSSVAAVVWKVARSEMALRAEFGAEIASLKEKVYKVEIWARDEFVRKSSFEMAVGRLESGMSTLGSKFETAVDKMMARIDSFGHREHG